MGGDIVSNGFVLAQHTAGQLQYRVVAIKPHNTNGQGSDGDIEDVSEPGNVNVSDRALDFENGSTR